MKKIITLVMCFSVVLLSACDAHETSKLNSEIADTTTTAATTSEITTAETTTTTAAATSETTTIETTTTFSATKSNFNDNDKLKQADECFSILDEIYHVPLATAGSTLKGIRASAHFLNWTESTTMTDDEIAEIAKYYFSSINSYTDAETFLPVLNINFNINFKYCEFIINKDRYLLSVLSEAGNAQKYDSYSMDKYIRCRNIIQQYIPIIPHEKTQMDDFD